MAFRNRRTEVSGFRIFLLFLFSVSAFSCNEENEIVPLQPSEHAVLAGFRSLEESHNLRISPEDEPGTRLELCLTFTDRKSGMLLSNHRVHVYHTDIEGDYQPTNPDDESTARLNGSFLTNDKGQAYISTILPGDYGSGHDNRHIHTNVEGAIPEAYDIHFAQFSTFMGRKFIAGSDQHFLADLKRSEEGSLVAFLTMEVKLSTAKLASMQDTLPDCEWCGAMDAPDAPGWSVVIADSTEPGERLVLSGTVYKPDGKTPAEGILVYAYHTNQKGVYDKNGNETGNGKRHGHLRGWAKTNKDGKYRFFTIKPEPYPSRSEPAHIHMTLTGPDFPEYWLYSTLFEGDPLISDADHQEGFRGGGFPHIIPLKKDAKGVLQGERNIVLRDGI